MIGTETKPRRIVIQDRDRLFLEILATVRIVDRELAKLLAGFGSTTRANTRLLALTEAGLLRRFFIGTTAGGTRALYALSPKGAALIGIPYKPFQRTSEDTLVGDLFVEHQLRLNWIFAVVTRQPIPITGLRFVRWNHCAEPLSTPRIIPDGYFELESLQGFHSMFLEVDLGTESMKTWDKKVQAYLNLALSGEFESRFQKLRFRTLVVASSQRRLGWIRKAVLRRTEKIFWFSTLESINRDGFWSAVWLRPQGDEKLSLASSL